jgi:LuxR family maltose regulon positive regulatory protein
MGDLLREWNELEAAHQQLTQGMELVRGELSVDADVVTMGYVALAKLSHALGDLRGGIVLIDEFVQFARRRGYFAPLVARGEAVQTQLWLASGGNNLAAAVHWAETSGLHADDNDLPYLRETEYLTLARVLIVQHRTEEAMRLLARMLPNTEAGGRMGRVVEILMLQALALRSQKMSSESSAALSRALALAEPQGFIRVFVDEGAAMQTLLAEYKLPIDDSRLQNYVIKLLAAFGEPLSAATPSQPPVKAPPSALTLVEQLSTRELEVLRLVADGLSNSQIAARLIVSTGTIKTHVNHIYGKLGVPSRTQAIARGRAIGLLID